MSNVFQRVVQHLANEVITKSLAQSKWFQSFAARTHLHVSNVSKEGVKKMEEVKEKVAKDVDIQEAAGSLGYRLGVALGNISRVPANFVANVKREMEKIQIQQGKNYAPTVSIDNKALLVEA